jgi:DNA-binding NarL/FixJ family response regulator
MHHLDAASALSDACAAPYERALTLLALAELRLAMGDRDGVRAALCEARTLLVPLEARPALARADAITASVTDLPPARSAGTTALAPPVAPHPAGLTAREVEVLRLVAAGQSSREMAAALCRSERTVERHIENIYRKIAARNRADATVFALRHQLT